MVTLLLKSLSPAERQVACVVDAFRPQEIAQLLGKTEAAEAIRTWRGLIGSYAVAGHAGQIAMEFTIARPGTYLLGTKDVRPRAITDLAVGRGILPGMLRPVLLAVPGLCVLAAAGGGELLQRPLASPCPCRGHRTGSLPRRRDRSCPAQRGGPWPWL